MKKKQLSTVLFFSFLFTCIVHARGSLYKKTIEKFTEMATQINQELEEKKFSEHIEKKEDQKLQEIEILQAVQKNFSIIDLMRNKS